MDLVRRKLDCAREEGLSRAVFIDKEDSGRLSRQDRKSTLSESGWHVTSVSGELLGYIQSHIDLSASRTFDKHTEQGQCW